MQRVARIIVHHLAALLAFAYRRWWQTLVSLVPITLTIATLLGFIALSGLQLNLLTAIVSSIVLGVGIDYVTTTSPPSTTPAPQATGYVLRAIDRAGPPIVASALGIAIALSALWLSPLRIHAQLSQIMWSRWSPPAPPHCSSSRRCCHAPASAKPRAPPAPSPSSTTPRCP